MLPALTSGFLLICTNYIVVGFHEATGVQDEADGEVIVWAQSHSLNMNINSITLEPTTSIGSSELGLLVQSALSQLPNHVQLSSLKQSAKTRDVPHQFYPNYRRTTYCIKTESRLIPTS